MALEVKELKTMIIDVEKGIYQLNGEDIGEGTSELHLSFEFGRWSLVLSRDLHYRISAKDTTE